MIFLPDVVRFYHIVFGNFINKVDHQNVEL